MAVLAAFSMEKAPPFAMSLLSSATGEGAAVSIFNLDPLPR